MSTPLLGLILPTTGSLSGAWGTAINDSITSLLDSAVAGTTTLSADDNVTLTTDNDVANQARQAILLWTATGTVTRNITAPLRSKPYIVINASSTQSIVLRATGPTTGVIIEAGEKALCVFNTNTNDFVKIATSNSQIKISVTPEQFGAVGNGVTNDRVALQAALDSGFDVFLTLGKTYYYTGASLKMTTHNQAISGGGVLRPSGAINALVVGAENEVAVTAAGANLIVGKSYYIHDLGTTNQTDWNIIAGTSLSPQVYVVGSYFIAAVTGTGIGSGKAWLTTFGNEISIDVDAYTQTAGYYALYIGCGNRIKVSRLYAPNAGAGLYVTKSNTVSVEWMWATLRGPGITWYGNALQRSDILNIVFAVVVPGATYYGLNWDGNCHTLTAKYLGMVGDSSGGKGMIIQNTSGSTIPAVGRFGQVEIDYPQSHAIEIVTAYDIDIEMPYLLGAGKLSGSASVIPDLDGIRIGSAVTSYEVRISGGKSVGNSGYGINALGGIIYLAGNTSLYNNGSSLVSPVNGGAYNNPTNNIQNRVPWYSVDDNFYLTKVSNNPVVAFNPYSSLSYDRTNKSLNLQIANSASSAGVAAITFTNSYVNNLLPLYAGANGVAGGEVRWYGATSGYMRFVIPSTVTSTTYTWPSAPINGYFLQTDTSGNLTWAPASGGGGGVSTVTATPPVFSTGGANPIISVNASSSVQGNYLIQRDANGDFAGRIITATQFTAASNYYITLSGTDAVISFDANDYLSYDRTNNQYNFQINGSGVLALNATALQSYKPVRIQGTSSGYVGFAAQATAGTTTYTWPTAPVTGNYLQTDASGNLTWAAASGGVTSVSVTSPVKDTGTASVPNIGVNAASANTFNYLVQRDSNGDFSAGTITATQYTVAANYYLTLSASNPNIVFDANDYISYSRSTNECIFYVNGSPRLNINANNVATYTNVSINGLTLGTGPGSGSNNTVFGDTAGASLNLASNNTVVGALALGSSVNSGSHCAFGYGSLNAVNSGQQNSAFGFAALAASTNITNSSGFGNGTAVTGDNQVQLGNSATTTYYYAIAARSDLRDKTDVRDTQLGLGFINALRPVDYKWDMRDDYKPPMPEDLTDKEAMAAWAEACNLSNITHDGSKKRSRYHHGLIAQEVKAVLDAQGIDFGGYQDHKVKDGQDVLTIGYDELIAPLIKAIQELTARVQALEAK